MKRGDPCRTRQGWPARYLGEMRSGGVCCFVVPTLDGVALSIARPARGNECLYPLPKRRTLKAWSMDCLFHEVLSDQKEDA